jgi:Cu-Zn family superoxide dismutase
MEGVGVFQNSNLKGYVLFTQTEGIVTIKIEVSGLAPKSYHGFHIHKSGDLRRGCDSCCSHYNPDDNEHGGLEDENSHAGDLGNIYADESGVCNITLSTDKFFVEEIIGRSIIIHESMDDLGRGGHKDSKTTGNSGKRIACAVIGFSEKSC